MMARIFKIFIWILIAGWFAIIMGFVSGEADRVLCNHIEVTLTDTVWNRFVTRSDVRAMLEETDMQLQGYPLAGINTQKLEKILEQNRFIRNAEVSKDISGRLEVTVEQRVPLVRVMPEGTYGFYLDMEGAILPLSDQFTPMIMLVSGNIPRPAGEGPLNDRLLEIYRFSKYLSGHPLWKDQIVQVYINREGEYELIPRVGAHHILLGSMDQWERKLANLELLYAQGFAVYGWNTYGTINLKYTNQVICTKR